MLIAHYIGDHASDSWSVRAGWLATRLVQKGRFGIVTHCEALVHVHCAGVADIASSSVRDGGVRIKEQVQLDAGKWLISDVPQWDAVIAAQWFAEHDGAPYDWRGAWAAVMPGHHRTGQFFCNESVGASVGLQEPHIFTPAQFAAICFTLGRDLTAQFFEGAPAAGARACNRPEGQEEDGNA